MEGMTMVSAHDVKATLDSMIETTRRAARDNVRPYAAQLDDGAWIPSVWETIRSLGIIGVAVPEEYGGLGLPYSHYLKLTTELSRASAVAGLLPALNVLIARALIRSASEDAIETYLPGLVDGTDIGCWCFTEPATGSDPRSITTRAERDGNGWRISGRKVFISHSSHASIAVVFAQLDGRLTAFVGRIDEGFRVGSRERLLAFNGADTGEVVLDGFRATHIIGTEGNGFDVLLTGEAEAKLRASAILQGIAEQAVELATEYARQRTHREVPIGEKFASIQWLLAEGSSRAVTIRALVEHGAAEFDSGRGGASLPATVKLVASRTAREVTNDCLQVFGAYGVSRDHEIERLYRQAKVYEVVQGVSEINRTIIAKHLLQ